MKKLILLAAMFFSLNSYSQNVKLVNGNYVSVSTRQKTEAKQTGQTFTDNKGVAYPVMITDKQKLFVIRTSKKTGKEYKQYLKVN